MYIFKKYYPAILPLAILKYYFLYTFLALSGKKGRAMAVLDAINDFKSGITGRSEKY